MDIQKAALKAVELKESGYNCAQAVLEALKDDSSISSDELYKIGSGFAAGMGNTEGVCGALVASCIIAGMKNSGKEGPKYSRLISDEFKKLSGAIICKDLKTPPSSKMPTPCSECVRNAVLAYGKIIQN